MGILANAEAALALVEQANIEPPELGEILCDIVEADKRAGEVIRRLREMLRKGQVQHQPLNVNDVVNDVLRLMRHELLHRGVAASLRLTQDIPLLRGDRVQMQQVLINLCMNACDAMNGCNSPQVQICTRRSDAYALEISVADCGSGIPATELERVFEPFVTTKEHGMGLGLSVCRTIVAAHGGRLWAENNPNTGATFRLAFPTSSVAS